MTECPTCRLSMESHSTGELLECCMNQVDDDSQNSNGICPNCKHEITKHSDKELVECTLDYLRSM